MAYMISYKRAMEIVEKFMEETGIRDFCTNYCRGWCCNEAGDENGCYEGKNSCAKIGRKLECSMFICNQLRDVINGASAKRDKDGRVISDIFGDLRREIINKIHREIGLSYSVYFGHLSMNSEEMQNLKFDSAVFRPFRITYDSWGYPKSIRVRIIKQSLKGLRRMIDRTAIYCDDKTHPMYVEPFSRRQSSSKKE